MFFSWPEKITIQPRFLLQHSDEITIQARKYVYLTGGAFFRATRVPPIFQIVGLSKCHATFYTDDVCAIASLIDKVDYCHKGVSRSTGRSCKVI